VRKILILTLLAATLAAAAEKKPPQAHAENETVDISATVVPQDQVKAAIGSDLRGNFTVLAVRITPKGGKPLDIQLDDFVLRSQSDGDHSGPLAAAQVAEGGALVVQQTFAARSGPDAPQIVASSNVEMKDTAQKANQLEALKKKILPEKSITEPVEGWLFFPLERAKPKGLALIYGKLQGKLRLEFK
jgi:hypothetical protein